MNKEEIRIEAMAEILSDLEISLPAEKIKELTRAFVNHIELESEISSYQHIGHKDECGECKRLRSELGQVEAERDIYHKSVCDRRKTKNVWIEGESVMYK